MMMMMYVDDDELFFFFEKKKEMTRLEDNNTTLPCPPSLVQRLLFFFDGLKLELPRCASRDLFFPLAQLFSPWFPSLPPPHPLNRYKLHCLNRFHQTQHR